MLKWVRWEECGGFAVLNFESFDQLRKIFRLELWNFDAGVFQKRRGVVSGGRDLIQKAELLSPACNFR